MADEAQRLLVDGEAGLHRDGDKPRLVDMMPAGLLLEAGRIWAQNNRPREGYPDGKYPDFANGVSNFKGGIRCTKYLDSIMRHLLAIVDGEDRDADSGFDHAGHILCNLAMFWWTRDNRKDLDDRGALPPGPRGTAAQPTSGSGWVKCKDGYHYRVKAGEVSDYVVVKPDKFAGMCLCASDCTIVEWGDCNA